MAAKRKVGRPNKLEELRNNKNFIQEFNTRAIIPLLNNNQINRIAKSLRTIIGRPQIGYKSPPIEIQKEFLEEFNAGAIIRHLDDKSIKVLANKLRLRYF